MGLRWRVCGIIRSLIRLGWLGRLRDVADWGGGGGGGGFFFDACCSPRSLIGPLVVVGPF